MTTSAAPQALQAVHGDEARVAGTGADQVDGRSHHRLQRSTAPALHLEPSRISVRPGGQQPFGGFASPSSLRLDRHGPGRVRARRARSVQATRRWPSSSASSPDSVAHAPIGIWHPPPSRDTTARSAASAGMADRVVDCAARTSRDRRSSLRAPRRP